MLWYRCLVFFFFFFLFNMLCTHCVFQSESSSSSVLGILLYSFGHLLPIFSLPPPDSFSLNLLEQYSYFSYLSMLLSFCSIFRMYFKVLSPETFLPSYFEVPRAPFLFGSLPFLPSGRDFFCRLGDDDRSLHFLMHIAWSLSSLSSFCFPV